MSLLCRRRIGGTARVLLDLPRGLFAPTDTVLHAKEGLSVHRRPKLKLALPNAIVERGCFFDPRGPIQDERFPVQKLVLVRFEDACIVALVVHPRRDTDEELFPLFARISADDEKMLPVWVVRRPGRDQQCPGTGDQSMNPSGFERRIDLPEVFRSLIELLGILHADSVHDALHGDDS